MDLPPAPPSAAALPGRCGRSGFALAGWGTCLVALGLGFSLPLMHAGFALALAGALLARFPLHRGPGFAALVLGAAWALGATTAAALRQQGVAGLADIRIDGAWYAWLILPIAGQVAADPRWRRWVVRCLVLAVGAGALLGILQFVLGHDRALRPFRLSLRAPFGERTSGFFGLHLTQAFIAATALLLLFNRDGREDLPRGLGWTARAVIGIGLLATQARAALAGFVLGLLAAAGLRSRRRLIVTVTATLVLGLAAVGTTWLVKPSLIMRIRAHQQTRVYLWSVAVEAIAARPVAGLGGKEAFKAFYRERLRTDHPDVFLVFDPDHPEADLERHPEVARHEPFIEALRQYRAHRRALGDDPMGPRLAQLRADLVEAYAHLSGREGYFPRGAPHAHSSLLTLAAFYGLPCAALYLLVLLGIARAGWRRRRDRPRDGALAIGLVVFALVAGVFEYCAGDSESVYALFLVLGLALETVPGRPDDPAVSPPTDRSLP